MANDKLTVTGGGPAHIALTPQQQAEQAKAWLEANKTDLAAAGIDGEELHQELIRTEGGDGKGVDALTVYRAAQTLQTYKVKNVDQLVGYNQALEAVGLKNAHLLAKVGQYFKLPEDPEVLSDLLQKVSRVKRFQRYDAEDLFYILIKLGERRKDTGKPKVGLAQALNKVTEEQLHFILPPEEGEPTADYLEFKVKHSFVETFNSDAALQKLYTEIQDSDVVHAVLGERPTVAQVTDALLRYVTLQETDQLINVEDVLETINSNPIPYFPKEKKVLTSTEHS